MPPTRLANRRRLNDKENDLPDAGLSSLKQKTLDVPVDKVERRRGLQESTRSVANNANLPAVPTSTVKANGLRSLFGGAEKLSAFRGAARRVNPAEGEINNEEEESSPESTPGSAHKVQSRVSLVQQPQPENSTSNRVGLGLQASAARFSSIRSRLSAANAR